MSQKMSQKRPHTPSGDTGPSSRCMFGLKCYRRNPTHFENFSHPHLKAVLENPDKLADLIQSGADESTVRDQLEIIRNLKKNSEETSTPKATGSSPVKNGQSRPAVKQTKLHAEKKQAVNPENKKSNVLYYLTRIKDVPSTHRGDGKSIYLTNMLRPAAGGIKLRETLQINFMVDFEWLWMNYEVVNIQDIPLTILFGEDNPELQKKAGLPANVTAAKVKMQNPFGTHHTKMMVLIYDDEAVRIIISTANLVSSDWENRTQGVWIGPKCPKIPDGNKNNGDSPTDFKASLLRYLNFYQMDPLKQFIKAVECCDFSEVKVFFIGSVPGSHQNDLWGHRAVGNILRKHLNPNVITAQWPLIVQCSSIGSLGPTPDSWVENELATSLGRGSRTVHMVYPSKANVYNSLDGALGGCCLPYSRSVHAKQPWLCDLMNEWKADSHDRTRAMPHIKTYTKISPYGESLAYVMLTSANLSKAAWGSLNKAGDRLQIKSYEAGVLFLPKFITGKEVFDLKSHEPEYRFYLPYDLPLKKFGPKDSPWLYDYLREDLK